jgi:hypothetical protein
LIAAAVARKLNSATERGCVPHQPQQMEKFNAPILF